MIDDIKECSKREIQDQIAYLERTPVRGIADLLRNGRCTLRKGVICSLNVLGNLKTEFGAIGSLIPSATEGVKKFRVAEVVPTLRANPNVNDGCLLCKIGDFIDKDRAGEVEYNVTIFDSGNEYIMKDGDKRTIAFYENRKECGNDVIEFPVYVVSGTQRGT